MAKFCVSIVIQIMKSFEKSLLLTGSQDVNIVFDKIRDPLELPDQLFGPQVKNITLMDVKLIEFSSQPFLNLNQSAVVTIKNSEITTTR